MSIETPQGRPPDEELSARLLEVTATLLEEHGYTALRIEHVARAAQCGKAAIYRRHRDKAALVAAAILARVDLGEQPDTGSLAEDLFEHARQNQRNQDGGAGMVSRGMQAMFDPEVFPILWDDFFLDRRDRGAALIARGVARGELPDDVDPDVILDTIAGLTLYRRSVKGIRVDDRHTRAVIDALLAHPPRRLRGAERTPSP